MTTDTKRTRLFGMARDRLLDAARWLVRRALVASLALPACLAPSAARAEGRYALLVGVEKYNPLKLPTLEFAEDDVVAMGAALEKLGFSVVTMTSAAQIPARRPASSANILEQVDRRLADREKSDTILLAFSGHGIQLKVDRADADGVKELWFCPEEAQPERPETLLAMTEVLKRLEQCAAGRKLLLVDACRNEMESAAGSKSGRVIELPAAGVKRPRIPAGMVAMFSCRPGEQSFELNDLRHSIFSHHVIEFLEGRADKSRYPKQEVGISELTNYVRIQTREMAEVKLAEIQVPDVFVPDGSFGDWPLGRLGEGPQPGERAAVQTERKPAMPEPKQSPSQVAPVRPAVPQPGEVIENSLGMKLVKIPAGEFDMGSDDFKDEQPVHRVRITKPFLMGQTEVTLGQFLEFYRAGPEGRLTSQKPRHLSVGYDPIMRTFKHRRENLPWDWGHPDMDVKTPAGKVKAFRYPVVNVSWGDCVAFCEWLSLKERKRYRLPTEAEWEYACRAGKTTRFWTGDDPESLTPCENVCDPTIAERVIDKDDRERAFALESRDGHALSAPVGSYGQLNPFGLADMHGNVSEWCSDWYDAGYYLQSPPADPKGAAGGVYRVIRGGSWLSHPAGCRSAYRGILQKDPDKTYYPEYALTVGFRVVRDVD